MKHIKPIKHIIIALLLCIFMDAGNLFAQQRITQGARLPVLTTEQRDQLSVDYPQSEGLFIYNRDVGCVEYWNGTEWIGLCQVKFIPRMTEEERDLLVDVVEGFLIYNTDEDCFNYYAIDSDGTGTWTSLCGGIVRARMTINCEDITFHGTYMEETPLNAGNYLSMVVNVTRAGAYTITATTDNGYGFNISGIFLNPGLQRITLPGQGTPIRESDGDIVQITINGTTVGYSCISGSDVTIPVSPANPTFAMDCSSVTVNGLYVSGTSLRPSNTITITVNVSVLGNGLWTASTNTVDGISFSGSGIFTSIGTQIITLFGSGTPTSARQKIMTITTNSAGIAATCTAVVNCVFSPKSILSMGNSTTAPLTGISNFVYGYNANTSASHRMVMAPINFGTLANSTVQVQRLTMQGVNATGFVNLPAVIASRPTATTLRNALATNPDIVIIGWGMIYTDDIIQQFIEYLEAGGVMIIMNKYSSAPNPNNSEAPFFRALFGESGITAHTITNSAGTTLALGSTVGSLFRLASIPGDPILHGPFGDLNGLLWGVDYFPATFMSGIPESQIITYSGANNATGGSNTGVTMFRHATLNLFWVGDGGFLSHDAAFPFTPPQRDILPFTVNAANQPVPRNNFGTTATTGGVAQTIHNSQLFANVLAWAIQQAENNGINSR